MPKLTIDGQEIEVEKGTSILQACEQLGIEVPRFCYHDRLSVPANCRMCLVQLEKAPKPVASCAMPCGDGMVVHTQSETATKARKGVMEFLLINHPLDCPICDQAGECDLQDQAMAYGKDRSRYQEEKRAVEEKNLGPLIKTFMTRCIHCTRCVRFSDEIAGTSEMGATGRGEHTEIGTYIEKAISSELSGNMIDVCPVGALTSKPYSFVSRPWELKRHETICVMDAVGSHIRVDTRGREVMRVLPRLCEEINEEWISDKTRFSYDGLKYQRLDRPYIRDKKTGKLQPASWEEALERAAQEIKARKPQEIAALAGDLCDLESMFALKTLLSSLGVSQFECRLDGTLYDTSKREGYLFNTGIENIEKADMILLVGTNPRYEATLVNARIRKRYLQADVKIGVIGQEEDLTYPYEYLGPGGEALKATFYEENSFGERLMQAKYPMIIFGSSVFQREDGTAIHNIASEFCRHVPNLIQEDWCGINMLHQAASRVGALDLGFVGQESRGFFDLMEDVEAGKISLLYLLAADDFDDYAMKKNKPFIIYQGHHGDKGAHMADIILPGAAFTEKNGIYVNMEGRPQLAKQCVFPLADAKEDWKIIRALSDSLDKPLKFNDLTGIRQELVELLPYLKQMGKRPTHSAKDFPQFGTRWRVTADSFIYPHDHYYLSNAICRSSKTMAQCTDEFFNASLGEDEEDDYDRNDVARRHIKREGVQKSA